MSPHRVTIPEAIHLTGRARRSLYRDMGAGRLSYHVGPNGRRLVDVSELIRAYGALPGMPEEEASPPAGAAGGGGEGVSARLLAEMLEVMREQREELAALRREVAELRRLPAPGQLSPHPDDREARPGAIDAERPEQAPAPGEGDATPREAPQQDKPPPRSFADLLEKLNARAGS